MARAGVGRRASGSVTWAEGRPRVRVPLGVGAEGARDAVGGIRSTGCDDGDRWRANMDELREQFTKNLFSKLFTLNHRLRIH